MKYCHSNWSAGDIVYRKQTIWSITDRFKTWYWISKLLFFSIPINACGSRKSFRDRYRMMLSVKRRWYSIPSITIILYAILIEWCWSISHCQMILTITPNYCQMIFNFTSISQKNLQIPGYIHTMYGLMEGFPSGVRGSASSPECSQGGWGSDKVCMVGSREAWRDPARREGVPRGCWGSREVNGIPSLTTTLLFDHKTKLQAPIHQNVYSPRKTEQLGWRMLLLIVR